MRTENYIPMKEAAKLLGYSYDGLTRAIMAGRITQFIKIGRQNFFTMKGIEEIRKRKEAGRGK
jgi:hypothetical protein